MALSISSSIDTITVYLNGVAANNLQVLNIERFVGGRQLDRATLELYASLASWTPLANIVTGAQSQVGQPCRIVLTQAGSIIPTCLHVGVIHEAEISIGEEERMLFTSSLKEFHFGPPVEGMLELNKPTGQEILNRRPIVFNPRIDGRLLGNKSSAALRFIDPESVRTLAAKLYQGASGVFWTFRTAVQWLCQTLNKNEQFVLNPLQGHIDTLPTDEVIRDVHIPIGMYLPDALDRLLEPLGYSWYLDLGNPFGKPTIIIFKRGVAVNILGGAQARTTPVYLAAAGSNIESPSQNDAIDIHLSWNSAAAVNAVRVYGDLHRIESTWELVPSWSAADDTLPLADLALDADRLKTIPETARVWREWVLNEAGDYIGLRPTIVQPHDLSPIFGVEVVPKRRRFVPTVTLRPDEDTPAGEIGGCYIEYTTDNGATWRPVESTMGNIQILDKECGIRFDGAMIPLEMYAATYPTARVRITASILGDVRINELTNGVGGQSPLNERNEQVIDLGDTYGFRKRVAASQLNSRVGGQPGMLKDGQQDDTQLAKTYSQQLLASWNVARINARVRIAGIPSREGRLYQPGDLITGVSGRAIDFALQPGQTPAYPQVVGVQYNWQQQEQTLMIDSHHSPAGQAGDEARIAEADKIDDFGFSVDMLPFGGVQEKPVTQGRGKLNIPGAWKLNIHGNE